MKVLSTLNNTLNWSCQLFS